ncbi:hypothetical protein BD769DRAFT_1666459 [Suillus cothurnatus]|nr:hypothetical protein BD769DRAFT_1666459 [Suillus cothurnatus]
MSHEGIILDSENRQDQNNVEESEHCGSPTASTHNRQSTEEAAYVQAHQKRRIAQLEEQLEALELGCAVKERQANYYASQGRVIRCVVTLFNNIEDLIAENNQRYEDDNENHTLDQDWLQIGYVTLSTTLPWFYKKGSEMEYDEFQHMLKMLKALVAEWVNQEFKPDSPVDYDDKHTHGFLNDACGRLLCPAELDWNNPAQAFEIAQRAVSYAANLEDLEEGLFKGKILVQGYKAIFMSPSLAKDVEGDGDGADIIQNNRCAKKSFNGLKVKKHVAQIINMKKVTPRSIAYIACLVRFSLSSVTSWRSVDGDFDYVQFWRTIVDFFERPPGQDVQHRVDRLLKWWSRKVFGWSHRNDISDAAKASMSVNALAKQRAQRDDVAFDSA